MINQEKKKKICRLKVVGDYDNLKYEVINYYKTKTKNKQKIKTIDKPLNNTLETYSETYERMKTSIAAKEKDSLDCIRTKLNIYLKIQNKAGVNI